MLPPSYKDGVELVASWTRCFLPWTRVVLNWWQRRLIVEVPDKWRHQTGGAAELGWHQTRHYSSGSVRLVVTVPDGLWRQTGGSA